MCVLPILQMNLSIATGRVDGCLGGIKKGVAVADSTRAAALFAAETKKRPKISGRPGALMNKLVTGPHIQGGGKKKKVGGRGGEGRGGEACSVRFAWPPVDL